jgi:hypothetical protein
VLIIKNLAIMSCKFTNIDKKEIETNILRFIPKNKRGFSSKKTL